MGEDTTSHQKKDYTLASIQQQLKEYCTSYKFEIQNEKAVKADIMTTTTLLQYICDETNKFLDPDVYTLLIASLLGYFCIQIEADHNQLGCDEK